MPYLSALRFAVLGLLLLGCSKSGESGGPSRPPPTGTGRPGLPTVPGTPDTSVQTALPPLPRLPAVTATVKGDSVSISVEPVEGGRDYRVYPLPADSAVSSTADGHVTVQNAIYRCGGDRQTPDLSVDDTNDIIVQTLVDNKEVAGYTRSLAEATLGYVYQTPGDGRIPVYAVGSPGENQDNGCFGLRWTESRVKRHITSETERNTLLGQRWRDDGIVFYIPAPGAAGTKPLYREDDGTWHLYYVDGPEGSRRGGAPVFNILAEPAEGAVPLMRVHYSVDCGDDHDELAPGVPRFERARYQGSEHPMFDLHWSGITEETVLVVEALDTGCPFQMLAPASRPAGNEDGIDYPAFLTLDDARAASPTGEVFINGHHAASNRPRPIARSFIRVSPGPKPNMDWFRGFGPDEPLPALTFEDPCDNPVGCLAEYRDVSDYADVAFMSTTEKRYMMGTVLGELWVAYADVGADVGGKFRMTANTRATMSADSYLHVTMEVDAFTTARRYPQIIVSEGSPPVQWNLPDTRSIILQLFPDMDTANWPYAYQVQLCDHRPWEVNDQCAFNDMLRIYDSSGESIGGTPSDEVGEHTGIDRSTHFDAYLSTRRAYLFLDGKPHACTELPTSAVPSGSVTVTFGDVLYHSGVDPAFAYHENNVKVVAKRHFDNLGFKSGVEGPMWDEARFPCYAASTFPL